MSYTLDERFKVIVKPLYDLEDMWRVVRKCARRTVGKEEIESSVSNHFKAASVVSEHSPIRNLLFSIELKAIPTYVAQQYSRHRIASYGSKDFTYLEEDVKPTDVEHFVRTQREDRTGYERGSQSAPVDYDFIANAQGLIDMSKKRLCLCADPAANRIWKIIREEVANIEPILGAMLVPSCLYRGFCPEVNAKCSWNKSTAADLMGSWMKRVIYKAKEGK